MIVLQALPFLEFTLPYEGGSLDRGETEAETEKMLLKVSQDTCLAFHLFLLSVLPKHLW